MNSHFNNFSFALITQFMNSTNCSSTQESIYCLQLSNWNLEDAVCVWHLNNLRKTITEKSENTEKTENKCAITSQKYNPYLSRTPSPQLFSEENCKLDQKQETPKKSNGKAIKTEKKRKIMPENSNPQKLKNHRKTNSSPRSSSKHFGSHKKKKKFSPQKPAKSLSQVLNGREINESLLRTFLTQSPAPRWRFRLDAFHKLKPSLFQGWPNQYIECLERKKACKENPALSSQPRHFHIFVAKQILDCYPPRKEKSKSKANLERGLTKFFEGKGFTCSKEGPLPGFDFTQDV
ncbi:ubx domain-containing protein [Anaeramoeba ignava]|uniref:Ubx domain-containing protein n=1 Tax=Anaeramoeba ignava TaxID=1746090 RepID=A0A9Q0LTF6_ANAIG|nr:ubx domain-containing protein [Anaeramoeba ignava]